MKTIPKKDLMLQIADHAGQKQYEKFKQETLELVRKKREAKERKDKEAEQPGDKRQQTADGR